MKAIPDMATKTTPTYDHVLTKATTAIKNTFVVMLAVIVVAYGFDFLKLRIAPGHFATAWDGPLEANPRTLKAACGAGIDVLIKPEPEWLALCARTMPGSSVVWRIKPFEVLGKQPASGLLIVP